MPLVSTERLELSHSNQWPGLFDLMASISFLGPLVAYAFISQTSIGWRGAYVYMCVVFYTIPLLSVDETFNDWPIGQLFMLVHLCFFSSPTTLLHSGRSIKWTARPKCSYYESLISWDCSSSQPAASCSCSVLIGVGVNIRGRRPML